MLTATLFNAQQGRAAMSSLWSAAKPLLMAGHRLTLTLTEQTRSNAQNAALHAALTDISRQAEWAGRKWDVEDWKRLLTAGWCRATAQGVELVPSVDGHGVDVLYRRTSKLTKAECSELLEYVHAWGAEHGVKFSAPKSWEGA